MRIRRRSLRWLAVLGAAALLVAGCGGKEAEGPAATSGAASSGFDAAAYFKGKTIHMVVSSSPGGGTDLSARFLATNLADRIPGKPRIAVTNVAGLGGITQIYNAPEDDLVIGATSQVSAIYTAPTDPAVTIDPLKVRLIGGIGADPRSVVGYGDVATAYPTLTDASGKKTPTLKLPATVGSPADVVSDAFMFPWVCEALNLPCEYVQIANDSSSDVNLMIQRGEVNIQGGAVVTMFRDYLDQLRDGKARFLFGYAESDDTRVESDVVQVPSIVSMLPEDKKAEYERILPVVSAGTIGKHLWAPPSLPDGAVEALRAAFADLINDPAKVGDLQSAMGGGESDDYNFIIKAYSGDEAQKLYENDVKTFDDNLDFYKQLQQSYYDKYWSK